MNDRGLAGIRLERSRPMREQIYGILRQEIVTGRLRPGQALDEKAIAATLAVSRTPVHEAVKKLADEGLVEVRAQSGTTVAPMDPRKVAEAHIIRRALEIESAALAALRIDEAGLARLADIHMLHEAAIERQRYAEAIGQDDAFHRTICEISGLPMLWRAIEISKAQLDRCRHMMLPREGRAEATLAEHRAIAGALAARDAEAARCAMREHLERSYDDTIRHFDTILPGTSTEQTTP